MKEVFKEKKGEKRGNRIVIVGSLWKETGVLKSK